MTNPKDSVGRKKVALGLVPGTALAHIAEVLKHGRDAYGDYNWRTDKISASVYYDAALRHLEKWVDGETVDPETRRNHLAHVASNMVIMLDALEHGTLIDDRPPAGKTAAVLDRMNLENVQAARPAPVWGPDTQISPDVPRADTPALCPGNCLNCKINSCQFGEGWPE